MPGMSEERDSLHVVEWRSRKPLACKDLPSTNHITFTIGDRAPSATAQNTSKLSKNIEQWPFYATPANHGSAVPDSLNITPKLQAQLKPLSGLGHVALT